MRSLTQLESLINRNPLDHILADGFQPLDPSESVIIIAFTYSDTGKTARDGGFKLRVITVLTEKVAGQGDGRDVVVGDPNG
jgi:hypothetical protein